MNKRKLLFWVTTLIAMMVPVAGLTGLIPIEIGFPLMFALLGIQQISLGLLNRNKDNKKKYSLNYLYSSVLIFTGVMTLFR